jgi:hypothetical protein
MPKRAASVASSPVFLRNVVAKTRLVIVSNVVASSDHVTSFFLAVGSWQIISSYACRHRTGAGNAREQGIMHSLSYFQETIDSATLQGFVIIPCIYFQENKQILPLVQNVDGGLSIQQQSSTR